MIGKIQIIIDKERQCNQQGQNTGTNDFSQLSVQNIAGLEQVLSLKVDKNHHHDTLYHRKGDTYTRTEADLKLQELGKVVSVTQDISLDTSHIGKILQFNNSANINVNISNLPAGSTISGVKNNIGNITFVGSSAPTSDNVINGAVNSSFSLIKNNGVSNLLINNK